jgi:hypothetical protein
MWCESSTPNFFTPRRLCAFLSSLLAVAVSRRSQYRGAFSVVAWEMQQARHRPRDIASSEISEPPPPASPAADKKAHRRQQPSLRTVLCAALLVFVCVIIGARVSSAVYVAKPRTSFDSAPLRATARDAVSGFEAARRSGTGHVEQPAVLPELQPPPFPPASPLPGSSASNLREAFEMSTSPEGFKPKCLSLNREYCPPLNLSIQTEGQQRETHKYCAKLVKEERVFTAVEQSRFCGKRLPRLNPCWTERGVTSCLPHFFILGEMKCGTTSLYSFLRKHPRVAVPRVKEPRFLQPGRFAQTTASRYKVNFDVVTADPSLVTFDASPVYLRSAVARSWLRKWLPDARLITLVRDPVQRAYSHWKMGREWMESKCTSEKELLTLAPIMPHLSFDDFMERSLMQMYWSDCETEMRRTASADLAGTKPPRAPNSFSWLALPRAEIERARPLRNVSSASDPVAIQHAGPLWQCLVRRDETLTHKFARELLGEWPAAAERKPLEAAISLVGHCTEMMLFPPGALTKGALYAEQLEEWAKFFPRAQLRVIHTDELTDPRRAQAVMDETFRFLGLRPITIGNETRMCVHGKAGVMDVLNAFEGSVKIGSKDAAPEQLSVGACESSRTATGMHRDPTTGAMHHDITPSLEERMYAYYQPTNKRLYDFLGRDLGWGATGKA